MSDLDLTQLRITIDDVRAAGHCASGARTWFESRGINFKNFLRNGIAAADLLATGDGQAAQVVERKIKRDGLNGR